MAKASIKVDPDDICHFAVVFEQPEAALSKLLNAGIKIGKLQISAALRSGAMDTRSDQEEIQHELSRFDEPSYLHQAVVKARNGSLHRFPDIKPALHVLDYRQHLEGRAHFHVPIFTNSYGALRATQTDIVETLALWKNSKFTNHLEVETYTWDVLPNDLQTEVVAGIKRELNWILDRLS